MDSPDINSDALVTARRVLKLEADALTALAEGLDAAFEQAVQRIPEIMECYLMTGEFDYLLRLVVSDMADFERLHNDALTRLPGVSRVNSSIAIRTVRKTTELPID